MSLFKETVKIDASEPLASRMRPRNLAEFVGQEEIVGEGTLLRKAIEYDGLSSVIFWGPPGCGKTALAMIIADSTKAHFVRFSAVTAGVSDIRKVIKDAQTRRKWNGQKTILFVDELHRFNKAQQDAFLPWVENGTIILIGATTENPYFELNAPLISRSRIYTFRALTDEELHVIIDRALKDEDRGLAKFNPKIDEDALQHLINVSEGDARSILNALELAVTTTAFDKNGIRNIDIKIAEEAIQRRALDYDKDGDSHYDTISAFIKSMRGSDPDAALYWLARMLYAGEDPRFIARRMIVQAAEDIGNADPIALVVATAAAHAVEYVGMPEAQIPLAQAAIYLSCAPKSNAAYLGISRAMKDVENKKSAPVPDHLKDPHRDSRLGHGVGYKYPHSYPGRWVKQEYLPKGAKSQNYYDPTDSGYETQIKKRLNNWRKQSK